MKKLFAALLLIGVLHTPARADTSLGTWTCGMGNCATVLGLLTQATFRMSVRLDCAPNNGNGCTGGNYGPAVPGEYYILHVNVRIGPGIPSSHAVVRAKAGPIPTINNTLQWSDIEHIGGICPAHPHIPPMLY